MGAVLLVGLPFLVSGGPGLTSPTKSDSGAVFRVDASPVSLAAVPRITARAAASAPAESAPSASAPSASTSSASAPSASTSSASAQSAAAQSASPSDDATAGSALPTADPTPPAQQPIVGDAAKTLSVQTFATQDWQHVGPRPAAKPLPPVDAAGAASGTNERRAALAAAGLSCPVFGGANTSGAPGITSAGGVGGTTSDDLASFAAAYNAIRADNCLDPVSYFVYDSCMEARLFWMAEDPSEDPMSAWGHIGSVRSDGVPSVGCDGNLAGGYGNTGALVASKWWYSLPHQASLYRPGSSTDGVCVAFAMTHGGVPDEPYEFTRAAARWISC